MKLSFVVEYFYRICSSLIILLSMSIFAWGEMSYKFPTFESLKSVDGIISDLKFVNHDLLINIDGDGENYLFKSRFGGKEKVKALLDSGYKLKASMSVYFDDKIDNYEVYALKINDHVISSFENSKIIHAEWKTAVNCLSFLFLCIGIVGFVFGDALAKKYKENG